MPAKKITRDIGGATYNAFSTAGTPVADASGLINVLGSAIGEGITSQADEELVGPEGSQVPGLEGLGEARVVPGEEFDMDKALNLRQIKRAKEQGILNETQARIKVGEAIRAVAVDFPGREDTLRQRAGVYFGKFGEGDLVLTKSSAQKSQEAIFVSSFLKPGVAAGIIDPLDPFGDKEGQAAWQNITHDATTRKTQVDVVETNAALGKASGFSLANAYVSSEVSNDIAQGLQQLDQARSKGRAITDPLEINNLFATQKIRHKQVLRNKLSKVRGMTTSQKKEALAEIDNAYKDLDVLIENGSLNKMLSERKDLLTNMATVYGIGKYPELFAAEKASPGIGTSLLKMSATFGRMQSDASRRAFIDRQPPMVRNLINQTLNDPMSISNIFSEAMANNTLSGNEFFDSLFLSEATKGMHTDLITNGEQGESFKEQSIAFVLKNAPNIGALEDVNTASISNIIRKDKRKLAMLSNKFVVHETAVVPRAQAVIHDANTFEAYRKVELIFDPDSRKFDIKVAIDLALSPPPETTGFPTTDEAQVAEHLNVLFGTVDTYGIDLDIKQHEWVANVLKIANMPIEEQKED